MDVEHTVCFKGSGNSTSPEQGSRCMGVYYSCLKCKCIVFNAYYHFIMFKRKTGRDQFPRWPRSGVVLIQIIYQTFKALHDLAPSFTL